MTFEMARVLKDSTDTLRFHVPLLVDGAITAVEHKLRTPTEDFGESWEAASYDAADSTISTAASKGDERIYPSGGSGMTVGNRYAIGSYAQVGSLSAESEVSSVGDGVEVTYTGSTSETPATLDGITFVFGVGGSGSADAAGVITAVGGFFSGTIDAAGNWSITFVVPLASTSLTIGYFSGDTSVGRRDLFTAEVVAEEDGNGFFRLRTPLPVDVAADSPYVGRTVSHALQASETAELGFGLVQWKVTIGGQVYRFDQPFEVVDQKAAFNLNRDLLLELIPRLHDLRFPTDPTWEKGIRAAWYADLAPALAEAGIIVGRIQSWEVLNAWHAQLVFARTVQQLGDQFDERFVSAQWERADVMRRQAIKSRDWWVSEGKSSTRDAHPGEPNEQAPRGASIKINL